MVFSTVFRALSPVARGVEMLFLRLRYLGFAAFYPFIWAHERTHYFAARPWRLEGSEIEMWTLEPRARILYDLDETPWWAVRLVGLAPTFTGYLTLCAVWFGTRYVDIALEPWVVPFALYLGVGWLLYTVPSKSDIMPEFEPA